MRFIVASYGTKHLGMLLTHLDSIVRSHPAAGAAIYWQDIPAPVIDAIRVTFPRFDFMRTEIDFQGDWIKRISSKVMAWRRAADDHAGEERLCFADVDTLILRDLAPFFARTEADIVFTFKPERTPLNTGVMLARGGSAARAFFHEWEQRTNHILETPALYAQANDFSLGYGGTDQMSFFQMIGYESNRTDYELALAGERVRLHGEPCAQLNETNSRPLSEDISVVHYKAGWQSILLKGRPFTKNRPRVQGWEMFVLYLRRFQEVLAQLNTTAGTRFAARDFGIVIPSYCDPATGHFDAARYAVWCAREAGKSALRTLGYAAAKVTGGASSAS
jgi:hypothetical protein